MTISALALATAFSSGVLLGVMFFGGLWWTVRHALFAHVPALWFSASSLLRTAAALGGFFLVSHGEWRRLLACLFGFFLARMVVVHASRVAAPAVPATIEASP